MKTRERVQRLQFRVVCLLFFTIIGLTANAEEFKVEYSDRTAVDDTDIIEMIIAHCDNTIINTTDGHEASMKIVLTIDASSDDAEEASKMLNQIDFKIERDRDGIVMDLKPFKSHSSNSTWFGGGETEITTANGKSFEFSDDVNIDMSIVIEIPKSNSIDLEGSHSSIDLGYLTSRAEITLSHSSLDAEDIGVLDLNSSFGEVSAGSIKGASKISMRHSTFRGLAISNLEFNAEHSEFDLNRCNTIVVSSIAHSDFDLNQAENVTINSSAHSSLDIDSAKSISVSQHSHGNVEIDGVETLSLKNISHSNIGVEDVAKSIDISAAHSNIEIDEVGSEIENIEIEDSHASISINTDSIRNFDLFLVNSDFTSVHEGDNTSKKADGYYQKRSSRETPIEITISCPHGNIVL